MFSIEEGRNSSCIANVFKWISIKQQKIGFFANGNATGFLIVSEVACRNEYEFLPTANVFSVVSVHHKVQNSNALVGSPTNPAVAKLRILNCRLELLNH